MAFDPNSIPKDLRPINIGRTLAEDSCIATMSSPASVPVYYPTNRTDTGFTGLGYRNVAHVAPGWRHDVANGVVNCPSNLGVRMGGSGSSQVSDEGVDDSVSSKKVKFLCSFGGNILPRPSDGMLRYVGGQKRIISFRRDVSFVEFVQKIISTFGQNVIIKYQLPDEDLDALVSVSGSDDLENMMDEYDRLVERSSDGSAKLRVFLFSPSEVDTPSMGHFVEFEDSGQRYVEAVVGVNTDLVVSGGIQRKESIESANSAQTSDFSGTEATDLKGFSTEPLSNRVSSPKANSSTPQDRSPRVMPVDNRVIVTSETSSASQLGVPIVQSSPQVVPPQHPTPYFQTFGPIYSHTQFNDNGCDVVQPQQYIPPLDMMMAPPPYSHVNMRPNMGFPAYDVSNEPSSSGVSSPKTNSTTPQDPSPRVMPLHNRVIVNNETSSGAQLSVPIVQSSAQAMPSRHPDHDVERQVKVNIQHPAPYFQTFVPPQQFIPPMNMRMIPPPTHSHASTRPNLVFPMMQQDQFGPRIIQLPNGQSYHAYPTQVPYGWHQVPKTTISEETHKFKGCDMCEKRLHHAHSDTSFHVQRVNTTNPVMDTSSVYHSLHVDDKTRLQPSSSVVEQQVVHKKIFGHVNNEPVKPQPDVMGNTKNDFHQYDNDRVNLRKEDSSNHMKTSFTQPVPVHYPTKQHITMNLPVMNDIHLVQESPKGYSGNLNASAPKEVVVETCDHVRKIDGKMENFRICPLELTTNSEQIKPPVDNAFIKPKIEKGMLRDHLPRPIESSEMLNNSASGNPTQYQLAPDESSYGNYPLPGVKSSQIAGKVQPVDWAVEPSQLQPKLLPKNVNVTASTVNMLATVSPVKNDADILDSSNSLFSNQDPWDVQHETLFSPPLPNKIALKKEALGTRAPLDENQFSNFGDSPKVNSGTESRAEFRLDEVDFHSGHARTSQDSSEEQIHRDLEGVAEGVAASVLKSSMPSDPDLTKLEWSEKVTETILDNNIQHDVEMHEAKNEDSNTEVLEKANLTFPASDGLGRLQIIKNSDLEELRELGSGTFGTVYHGKWRGTDVAIKRINDRCFAGKPSEIECMRDDFWNEAIKLADLHHPNVVAFYGVALDGPGGSVATVTEYMVNGSLRTALQKKERNLDKRKFLLIAMDVAFGMEYLHGKNIVHFDLKSDNLLVNLRDPHRPICKVGDLGLSKVKCHTLISGGVRGTLPWMAPELLNGSSSLVSEKVDVFSFGIVMWELITGEEPYADLHYGTIIGGIVNNTLRPPVPESCDPEWRSLMERCWSAEPSGRPNFTEVANELRAIAAKIPSKA